MSRKVTPGRPSRRDHASRRPAAGADLLDCTGSDL